MVKILVAGDSMLDCYECGIVKRISPEAPVPVLNIDTNSKRYAAGGAANVAVNLSVADAKVSLFSIVGNDGNGKILREILSDSGVDLSYLIIDSKRQTTSKLRYIGQNHQQLLRVDSETVDCIHDEIINVFFNNLRQSIVQYQCILISDYNKGFLTEKVCTYLINLGKINDIPVIVDVKDRNIRKYFGADILKPNRNELSLLTGLKTDSISEVIIAARQLRDLAGSRYVLTTLGAEGMILVGEETENHYVKSFARAVYDVTGAGDTSAAYLALELANGKDIVQAMEVSNYAAGIQVSKVGTSVVTPKEIERAVEAENSCLKKKEEDVIVLSKDKLKSLIKKLKKERKRIVFTNGCFDIIHAGHIQYLAKAKELGDVLIVGINSDDSIRRLKGTTRPINLLSDRECVLASISSVDYVVPFEADTPLELIIDICPDIIVKGGDYKENDIVGANFVKERGGIVKTIPFVSGKSSTEIIRKCKEQLNE